MFLYGLNTLIFCFRCYFLLLACVDYWSFSRHNWRHKKLTPSATQARDRGPGAQEFAQEIGPTHDQSQETRKRLIGHSRRNESCHLIYNVCSVGSVTTSAPSCGSLRTSSFDLLFWSPLLRPFRPCGFPPRLPLLVTVAPCRIPI